MKKIISLILAVFAVSSVCTAQNLATNSDSKQENTSDLLDIKQENPYNLVSKDSLFLSYMDDFRAQLKEPEYKLYPTQNNWIFLLLNTRTGQIWLVQYSINNNPRMIFVLDDDIRISEWQDNICGRFVLQETKNIYNFLLLDQLDGRCWQVQWSFDKEERFVLRIY